MTTNNKSFTQQLVSKKWLYGTLVATALALGACSDEGSATTEDDPTVDAQTEIEQEATNVDQDTTSVSEESAVASANEADNEMGSTRGEVASLDGGTTSEDGDMGTETLNNEDIGVADSTAVGVDDADIIDGSESEEHVSTY